MKILCGDSKEVLKTLDDESVDLVVTSPPYDNLRDYKGFTFDFEGIARELQRVIKKGGVIVWVVGDQTVNGSETGISFKQAMYFKEIGLNLHDTMIYEKNGMSFPEVNRYFPAFEYMFVLSNGKPKTSNLIRDKRNTNAGDKVMGRQRERDGSLSARTRKGEAIPEMSVRPNIWRYTTGYNHTTPDLYAHEIHPAMFPEKLAEDHIISWSNKGDLVLDPFVGSGTTGKMAKKHGRDFIGIDISPEYCALAERRINSIPTPMF